MFDNDFFSLILDDPFTWDKNFYKFNRTEKDMHPYSVIDGKDSIVIVHNVLGVDKKDLKLSIKREASKTYLSIEGKTKDIITTKEYSVSSRFELAADQLDLTKVSSQLANGLLYITIVKKKAEPQAKTINIEIL
jgi:HSP20 family molecular chaperone IbpA